MSDLQELLYLRGLLQEEGLRVLAVDGLADTFELEKALTGSTDANQSYEDIEGNGHGSSP